LDYAGIKRGLHIFKRDVINRIRYGADAPRFGEAIFINPTACESILVNVWNRKHSGDVTGGDWDLKPTPLAEYPKFKFCVDHWVKGVPWKDTGAYEHLMKLIDKKGGPVDECLTIKDVMLRYETLDIVFEEVAKSGELRMRRAINYYNFREVGGVYFHIDRNNTPISGGGGIHRLAICKILKFSCVPAQIGVVHKAAVRQWRIFKEECK
jgi:hypothetical protein